MSEPTESHVPAPVAPSFGEAITSLATNNTYTIEGPIGEGNFGLVFACRDVWENELAAKVLKGTGTYEEVRDRALREVQKLLTLRHPNITYVFDAFEYRDTFYIVTERCHFSGHELFKIPNFDGFVWLVPVAGSILQALHYLHVNRYVHQDVHLGNIFARFQRDELLRQPSTNIQFKLADLGIARLAEEVSADNTRAQWMLPPEVLEPTEFGPTDYRVDIYHCGLVLLQLALSREMQFTREEVLKGKPRELALALPVPFSLAIEKMLRRHVQFRTASAMEVWRDLHSPVGDG